MNDAKPDVASLPAKWREEIAAINRRYSLDFTAISIRDCLEECARQLEAALAKPASGDGLPELPTPHGPWHATSDDTGYYTYTADQMLAIRDAGIAYGRRLATPEQPEGQGAAHFIVTVKDGDWTGTFEDWQTRCRARAPAAPGVRVDEADTKRWEWLSDEHAKENSRLAVYWMGQDGPESPIDYDGLEEVVDRFMAEDAALAPDGGEGE